MTFEEIEKITSLAKSMGTHFVVAIIVVIFCVRNIDKLLLLVSSIQKVFSFCSRRARKGAIANSIRGRIIKSSKPFRSFGNHIMISDLKIDWVKEEDQDTFIKNNQVIVRMKQNANPHQNFATAVTAFVGHGLLPHSKPYVDPGIYSLSQLSVSRLLILNGDAAALEYFDNNILNPVLSADEDAQDTFNRLRTIDKNGMFINILLNEYAKATQKIYPETPDPLLVTESRELLTYLYRIALGNSADLSELQFNREYFKLHIILAARTETYKRKGIKPYLKHINNSLMEGIETIYIFGLGWKTLIAKEIADYLKETDFRISQVIPHDYRHKSIRDGRTVQGVCYEISVYKED